MGVFRRWGVALAVGCVGAGLLAVDAVADGPQNWPPLQILDRTFGAVDAPGESRLVLPAPGNDVLGVFVGSSDSIVVAGTWLPPSGQPGFWLRRLSGDGASDASFGVAGVVWSTSTVGGVAVGRDGTIMVGAGLDGTPTQVLERYTANGIPDPGFTDGSAPGIVALPAGVSARPIGTDGSGRWYVRWRPVGVSTVHVRRLLANGQTDSTYAGGDLDTLSESGSAGPWPFVAADGRVTMVSDGLQPRVQRFTPTGAADATFGSGGSVPFATVHGLESAGMDNVGRLLVLDGGAGLERVIRFDASGAPVPFAATGGPTGDLRPLNAIFNDVVLPEDDGSFVVAGRDGAQLEIVRVTPAGTVDTGFNPFGPRPGTADVWFHDQTAPYLGAFATDSRGRVVVATPDRVARILPGTPPPDLVGVAPTRLLDTRAGGPQVGYSGDKPVAGRTIELHITGSGGVPVDARAVVVNVTGTDATDAGFVTTWPCDASRPTASSLNLVRGETAANLAVVKLSAAGSICLYSQSGSHLIVDVTGYAPHGSSYRPIVPARALDTRDAHVKPAPGDAGVFGLFARDPNSPLPLSAGAVLLNITGTDATAAGYVTVYNCFDGRPETSTLNLLTAETRANMTAVEVQPQFQQVCYYTQSGTHLVADVAGYFQAGSTFTLLPPTRVLDTRDGHTGYVGPKPPAGTTIELAVAGSNQPVPPAATSVLLNVTGTDATADGYVTVWPCGETRPLASSLNLTAGGTTPNLVLVKTGTDGTVCLYTQSGTHLVADLIAYD